MYTPRSFADPHSNLVVLSDVDIRRHIGKINDKDLPPECLPGFLHEAAHHWCFSSPVGLAELLLFFRARRRLVQFIAGGRTERDRRWDILDAVSRYEFALGIMRPLSEGIALFAEHDATVGYTATISNPLLLASVLFARGLAILEGTEMDALQTVLAGSRLTAAHIRRKANLLIQPFSGNDGGYLPGYLTVKNLWMVNLMGLKCPMFVDTDFYLQFIKTYFYSDWQLVARLLDDTIADVGSLGPIVDHLQQRLHSLATAKHRTEEAEKLEKEMLAGDSRLELKTSQVASFVTYDRLHDESDPESLLGKSRLQSLFRELFDSDGDNDLVELDILTLKLWSTITLGHADLGARTTEQHLDLSHDGKPIFRIDIPKNLKPGWSGTIGAEIVADTSPLGLFLFLTNEKGLVATIPLGLGEVPAKLKDSFVHARSRQMLVERTNSMLQSALDDDAIRIALEHSRRELTRLLDGIYLPRALFAVPDDKFEEVSQLMRQDGFLPLLENDLNLLGDTAAASLCIPLNHVLQSVSAFHHWTRSSPEDAVTHINSILSKPLGISVFDFPNSSGINFAFI